MTLQCLLNKRVRTAEGSYLGRLYSFRARREGPELVITHLRVGLAAWVHRLHLHGARRWLCRAAPDLDIPWEAIAAVDHDVRLVQGWERTRCGGEALSN
jgi:sporulation protein YlmC with PRC-barrel domain